MQQDDTPGLAMRPPTYPFIALVAAIGLEWLLPLSFLAAPSLMGWQSWLGAVLVLGGFGLALPAITAFNAAGTNVDPHKPSLILVTDGPYRFSRNPIYLGFLLIQFGVSLGFSLEWGLIFLPLVWLALDRLVVVREEAYLHGKFGTAYTDFLARTRRWL